MEHLFPLPGYEPCLGQPAAKSLYRLYYTGSCVRETLPGTISMKVSCSGNQIYFLWNPAVQYCVHNSLQMNVIQPLHPISYTWYIPLKYGPSPHSERSSFYELYAENNYSWSTLHFIHNPTLQTFIAFNVCRQTVSAGNVINVVQCPTSTDLI